jgi:RNA polymerase sigma-70 factor, ECF subfamily
VRGGADECWKRIADAAMARYASGDGGAFSELYDALSPRLLAFLTRQLRDADAAADILQQTFMKMHAARGHFARGAEVMPWAFAIARRLLIDRARRDQVAPFVPSCDDDPEAVAREPLADTALGRKQLGERLERELARLPEANRAAFELVKRDELSMAEAAEVLGTTVASVKVRAHRAYVALRDALGDEWEPEK